MSSPVEIEWHDNTQSWMFFFSLSMCVPFRLQWCSVCTYRYLYVYFQSGLVENQTNSWVRYRRSVSKFVSNSFELVRIYSVRFSCSITFVVYFSTITPDECRFNVAISRTLLKIYFWKYKLTFSAFVFALLWFIAHFAKLRLFIFSLLHQMCSLHCFHFDRDNCFEILQRNYCALRVIFCCH